MEYITLDVDDADSFLDPASIQSAIVHALKVTTTWLTKESVRLLGVKLRIRSTASRRRIKKGKVKGRDSSVWFGIRPLNLAYIRDYQQTGKGVMSGGDRFHKGAFVQSMNGSPELIFRRTGERPRKSKPRQKPLPKGQRRVRKSPPVEVVREEFDDEMLVIIHGLETEIQGIFKEAFLEYLINLTQ
ncbi:hypothetical protein Q9F39_004216 [Vibrio fluvialis]|nr:hypothetical protein [Vibrio fluvialis]